jgi:vacuolar protein sorting-associated protein 35
LRILVGTNLVRLSQLEAVTSKIYGEVILPRILDHIVAAGDPLSQAYLMDCLVQVFPDEYHIETLPILLNVCPRLRDKVNIRTILQGLMDRLANYLADEELLDESDTN